MSTTSEEKVSNDGEETFPALMIKEPEEHYESTDDLITPEKEDTTEVKKRKFYRYLIAGYILICIALLCESFQLLTAQLTVQQISMFETGIFKCIIQLITSGSTVAILRLPWKINWQHFHFVFLAAMCEYVGNACYYTASGLLPIGSLQVVFSVLVIILTAVVDTSAGRMNLCSIVCATISSLGVLLLAQPWRVNPIDFLQSTPCVVMSNFDRDIHNTTGTNMSIHFTKLITSSPETTQHVQKVISVAGLTIDAEITGYLLVFFGAIAMTAFYNFIQLLGQLYPVPTSILWVGGTETLLSVLLAIVMNNWKQPTEYWCIIFIICFIILKVALTFTLYFAFYFLKISHVITTLSAAYILLYMFQNSFLPLFYPPHKNVIEVAGTLFVVIGVMLSPCTLIMSKHNPYKMPKICDEDDEDFD